MVITRRIVKSGYSFLTTLPRYWIEQHKLEGGGKVYMEIAKTGELIIKKFDKEEAEANGMKEVEIKRGRRSCNNS